MRYLITVCFIMGSFLLSAQRTSTTTTHRTTSGYKKSTGSQGGDKIDSQSFTSRSGKSYRYTADFVASKYGRLQAVFFDRFGEDQATRTSGGGFRWEFQNANGRYCTAELYPLSLRLDLDRNLATASEYRTAEEVGDALQAVIVTHDNNGHQSTDPYAPRPYRLQKPLERKEERLQRALQELEAARRKVERISKEG